MDLTKERECNLDFLRIVCAIAVITIHVTAYYKSAITNPDEFGVTLQENIPIILLYNTLSRFAVPCFMMLSGAFLLSNKKNMDFSYFYKKSFHSIGIPTIIFSLLYFSYSEIRAIISIVIKGKEASLIEPIRALLSGAPYYHMWYMYTLIVVYLFIPLIIRLQYDINEKCFVIVSWIFMLISVISGWTSDFKIHWGVGKAICYVGYILIGYQLKKYLKKNNITGVICIFIGVLFELILTYIQYTHSIMGIAESDETYSLIGNFNPLVVLVSISIFAGFTMLSFRVENIKSFSSKTFLIYLIHAGIWDVLFVVLKHATDWRKHCSIIIPCCIVIVFLLSYIFSVSS